MYKYKIEVSGFNTFYTEAKNATEAVYKVFVADRRKDKSTILNSNGIRAYYMFRGNLSFYSLTVTELESFPFDKTPQQKKAEELESQAEEMLRKAKELRESL